MKYVSFLPFFVAFVASVASIELKCDLENAILDLSRICTISDVISNHEGDEFTSSIIGIYDEIVFVNSSLLRLPQEVVQNNNVLSLRMERCGLKIINPGTFEGVTSLVKLFLAGNRFETVDQKMFYGLSSLQHLDLTGNKIKGVAFNAFYAMEHLDYVSLATNKLTSLSLAFKSADGLKIDVRDNVDLNAVDFTCDETAQSCSILILDDNTVDLTCDTDNQYMDGVCVFSNIQVTEGNVFRVLRKWSELRDGYYRHGHLNTEYFKEIVFLNSTLHQLPVILFEYYIGLEYLNVSGTEISNLDAFCFKNASVLVDIDLSFNQITQIGPNIFTGVKQLSVIDLSNNLIENLDKNAFISLKKLTSLNLSGNQIKTIDLELHFNFPMVLNVSNCSTNLLRVTSYAETYIMPFSASVIDACDNDLTKLDLIKDGPIVTLLLENNSGELNLSDITSIKSLTTLSLRNVSNKIPNGLFQQMPKLESLDISQTRLTLKYGLFGHGSKVRKLDISSNGLREIDFYKLGTLHELEEITLDNNSLQKLEVFDLLMTFPHLKRISFLENPFYCDLLTQAIITLEDRQIEIRYPPVDDADQENNNVNGIMCVEYNEKEGSSGRNLALERQIDRLERTFLTIYAIKKAYL